MGLTAHHFTVDVEEYFHPTALAPYFPFEQWPQLERRSPKVIGRLLEFLARNDVRGTFFVLGWLAEREPEMVREISRAGHEIASHGFEHELVERLGPDRFRSSIRRSKGILEDITGSEVQGYRAPSFSIVPGLEWAFDLLLEEGYRYDASIFPISQHPTYGYPSAAKDPYWIDRERGNLLEFPATTASILGATVPASGGAYFRILPYQLVRTGLRQATDRGSVGMFYIHPWELDDWCPDVSAPRIQKFRTFFGRGRTWKKMRRMLSDLRFRRVDVTAEQMTRARARESEGRAGPSAGHDVSEEPTADPLAPEGGRVVN